MKILIVAILMAATTAFGQTNSLTNSIITVTNNAGEVLKEVKIVRVEDNGIIYRFTTSAGGGMLLYSEMPVTVRERLGYDPKRETAFYAAIKSKQDHFDALMSNYVDAICPPIPASDPPAIPISGLFGIKLHELLPTNCNVLYSNKGNGTFEARVVPHETNALFEKYSVTLAASNLAVITITAEGVAPLLSAKDVRMRTVDETFHERYGEGEVFAHGDVEFFTTGNEWKSGGTSLRIEHSDFEGSVYTTIDCTDNAFETETREHWSREQQRQSDANGL